MTKTPPLPNSEEIQQNEKTDPQQDIFDQIFSDEMNRFGKMCEDHRVPAAIVIAIHPEKQLPTIYYQGHEYDVAALLARVLRNMKQKFIHELQTDQ